MALEANAVKIEDLALLKLGTAPDRRQRWQVGTVCAISCAQANDYRAVFMSHRVKVINRLQIPGNFLLSGLNDLLFLTVYDLLHFRRPFHGAVQPIDARDVRTKIEAQRWIDAHKSRYRDRVLVTD